MTGVAAAVGVAGAVGSAVLPKLFGGSSGSATSGQTSGNTSTQSGPALGTPYLAAENTNLAAIQNLSTQAPFSYDVNQAIAPFNGQQQTAFQGVNNAANSWQNNFGNAANNLAANNNPMYNPTASAAGAFGTASATPTAQSASNPYFAQAGQSTPSVLNSYLSPNINNVIGASDQLQASNFTNSVMPSLTAGFVGSGGGLGSKAYGNATNMALTNLNQNIGNTNAGALQNAYNASTAAAQNDLSRYSTLGSSAGNLALGQLQGNTNLATSIGNNAALGNQTNIANATANQALGTGYLNNGLTGANAQLQIGNQQQQQQQATDTFNYNQALQQYQTPYQQQQFAANTLNQYQWPTQTNQQTNGSSSGTAAGTSNASPIGTGLGLATTIGSLPGGVLAPGGALSNAPAPAPTGQQYGPPAPAKRGGYFDDIVRRAGGGFQFIDAPSEPTYDHNPGYWGAVKLARGGHAKHDHDDDLYHRFMFGFNRMAQGGFAKHGQGNYGVGSIPHMARQGVPGDPYFSSGFFDGGLAFGAGGLAPTVRVGRNEVHNDIVAAKMRQAALARQQAAMSKPLQFRSGGYFNA